MKLNSSEKPLKHVAIPALVLLLSAPWPRTVLAQANPNAPASIRDQYHRGKPIPPKPPAVTDKPADKPGTNKPKPPPDVPLMPTDNVSAVPADATKSADSFTQFALNRRALTFEAELAELMQRKADTVGDNALLLDLQIDLRLLARAGFLLAADAKPGTAAQANAFIRATVLSDTLEAASDWMKDGVALSVTQRTAFKALHELSFKLDDLKEKGDELCGKIGTQLAVATNSLPAGGRLPPMRPGILALPLPERREAKPAVAAPMSLNDTARQLSVSMPLRRQLLALAEQSTAENDPNGPMTRLLADMVAIAQGLSNNTAVSASDREEIEKKIAEGLALYSDPRTRSLGQARLDSLAAYRQLLGRVSRLNLPGDLGQQMAPAFVWARENPGPGAKVLASIEKFMQVRAAHEVKQPDADLSPQMRKAIDQLNKKFTAASADFVTAAASLGSPDAGPNDLQVALDAMRQCQDLLELLPKMPADIKGLMTYHPRPATGLEKQVNQAAMSLGAAASPTADSAPPLLRGVHRLAAAAEELNTGPAISTLPEAIVNNYGGPAANGFDAKWRLTVTELASTLAATGIADDGRVNTLTLAKRLRQLLLDAPEVEGNAAKLAGLDGWIDFPVRGEQLQSLLSEYQLALTAGFEAFNSGDSAGVDSLLKTQPKRFQPVWLELARLSALAGNVQFPPPGLTRECAALLTPIDNAPNQTERQLALDFFAYSQAVELLPDKVDMILDQMARRLAQQ